MERGSHRDLRQHLGRRPDVWEAVVAGTLPTTPGTALNSSDRTALFGSSVPKAQRAVVNKRFRPLFGVLHAVAKQVYPAKEISKLERRPEDADAGRERALLLRRNHQQQDEQRSLSSPAHGRDRQLRQPRRMARDALVRHLRSVYSSRC